MTKKYLSKWFGYISTSIVIVVAIMPATFGIPTLWRPWICLASIIWFFLFSTGFFTP